MNTPACKVSLVLKVQFLGDVDQQEIILRPLAESQHICVRELVFCSMMAATVTDLISGTITALEGATDQYNLIRDDKGLQEAFHSAGQRMILIEEALRAANTQLARRDQTQVSQSVLNSLEACNNKAELSMSIFKHVAPMPKTSRFERYYAAVRSEGKGKTVEVLVMGMMSDVCALAENDAIRAAMEDQVKKLRDATEKLSKMEASVPGQKSGNMFNHYGTGDQLNAPGGTLNKSTGSGNHFPGATFSGSVSFGSVA